MVASVKPRAKSARGTKRWKRCSPGCVGWFRNGETLRIERCDARRRFIDDIEAEAFVRSTRPARNLFCVACDDAFTATGPFSRSASDPQLCTDCYVNGPDQ